MINPENEKIQILIVDDQLFIRNILYEILSKKYLCVTADSAEQALQFLQKEKFNLVLSDIEMGSGMSGIQMIPHVFEASPDTVVVMISGIQDIESAIESMRVGAFDYIQKPFDFEHIEIAVERALNHHRLLSEKHLYENHLEILVKQRTEQLHYLDYHDALTRLPNLALFEDRLTQSLLITQQNEKKLAVMLLSIDRFKKIQDTLGHEIGLSILQEIAERLKKCVSEEETVARFEGDEFALLLPYIQDTDHVVKTFNRIRETLKSPICIKGHEIFPSASAGISLFSDDGYNAQVLLKNARAALSRAEEHGGNNYQFYTIDMNDRAFNRLELENQLHRALEQEEFEVFYQPKVDITTKRIVGMEALVRWNHPKLGLVSPAEFIPLAEETGFIVQIGEWVLRRACSQAKLWQDKGFALQISVNLSTRQFQQNLAEIVMSIIHETGVDPCYLELEITESSIMKNAEHSVKLLNELKKSGIRIAIDDFGTGYSSLGCLKKLPIDTLKIDKSFISDITTNPDDAALVMAIITLSHNLRLKVIAEGVETEEQLRFLHLVRCDQMQGYLFSKPVTSELFEQMLRA
jgi:diguanylate cyclase (GGDEF)-like protein